MLKISTEDLKKIIIEGLSTVAAGEAYKKITFKNAEVKLSNPSATKRAKKLLNKLLEETNGQN